MVWDIYILRSLGVSAAKRIKTGHLLLLTELKRPSQPLLRGVCGFTTANGVTSVPQRRADRPVRQSRRIFKAARPLGLPPPEAHQEGHSRVALEAGRGWAEGRR